MARIKFFKDEKIAVYIYAEQYEKHHGKHILILKADEECQYGFDGKPLSCSKALKNKGDRQLLYDWILAHQKELENAWSEINRGQRPSEILD